MAFWRASGRQTDRAGKGGRQLFSAGWRHPTRQVAWEPRLPAFASRSKTGGLPALLRSASAAALRLAVQARSVRRLFASKAAMGAAAIHGAAAMAIDQNTDLEPFHASSPTDRVIHELQVHGYHPHQDEPDPRPLPDEDAVRGALADIFDALVSTLANTRVEPDLENLLWSTVNLFHRAGDRVQRELDRNEDDQKRSQKEQDGSEIRSVDLERLIVEGATMTERRNTMEFFRDTAADLFEAHTGSAWRPRAGSKVNHRALTAAMIDSRDYLAAKRRAEIEPLMPAGPRVAFAGGFECNDYTRIWDVLDKVLAKHPDMVLLHGGSPKGAEFIAARWADGRKVPQVVFKPDWTRHAKAAPFKRNDRLLQTMPIGVVVFPGSGITENLVDKARVLGIPVSRFGGGT
jgi:hypothetical protein